MLLVGLAATAGAQDIRFFSIGTGGTGATYYPLGGTIATAISNPPGSRPCEEGGSCSVPGLIAVAQSSRGSVDTSKGVDGGRFQSGFVQSDMAYSAFKGAGQFVAEAGAALLLVTHSERLAARADRRVHLVR